ncbi:MAG: hypothetical protein H0X31_23450 [Nostocaceae cyanobacterium]|nr:hypothetical protein [Nostocaceae cyanobacterium]
MASFVFEIFTWLVLASVLWSLWEDLVRGCVNLQRLHQIPCYRCTFFTGDYHLKCTVHPSQALTEEAINCLDYESTSPRQYCQLNRERNKVGEML